MRNRVKIALQVRVYYPEVARFHMPVHFAQRIFAAQTLPEAVASRLEFVLKDRLDHQLQRRLNHAVFDCRYTERALALALGYVHPSYRLRDIGSISQRARQFA